MPVNNPANLTVHVITGSSATIGATVQVWLRANLAVADELYGVQYVREDNGNSVTALILFEDQ